MFTRFYLKKHHKEKEKRNGQLWGRGESTGQSKCCCTQTLLDVSPSVTQLNNHMFRWVGLVSIGAGLGCIKSVEISVVAISTSLQGSVYTEIITNIVDSKSARSKCSIWIIFLVGQEKKNKYQSWKCDSSLVK